MSLSKPMKMLGIRTSDRRGSSYLDINKVSKIDEFSSVSTAIKLAPMYCGFSCYLRAPTDSEIKMVR